MLAFLKELEDEHKNVLQGIGVTNMKYYLVL